MSSKVCQKCGEETKRYAQCVKEEKTWYECADFETCQKRVTEKQRNDRLLKKKAADDAFTDKYGEINPADLIKVGVLYRDGRTYYYHQASDTLFGKPFHSNTYERRPGRISEDERRRIVKAMTSNSDEEE